jgi:hypothetical protein
MASTFDMLDDCNGKILKAKAYVEVAEVWNDVGADLGPVDAVTTILGVTTHGA